MTAQQIRDEFIKFFVQHKHQARPSSSLVPDNDVSVLLTTAGMQQFKPYFLGDRDPVKDFGSKRVTTIQKSFRTSDIDEVGDTSHLTFFEMLGNFSFGDYWKGEAIDLAWEFLTKKMHLNPELLWATVFAGDDAVSADTEAEKTWLKHIPKQRVIRCGRADNFWGPPGQSGSCGPSSEIHVQLAAKPQGLPNASHDFMEIWNLVFTEYHQNESGKLTPLPKKNIDTGMGLERLAMVVQKKPHIFATDLYVPIMAEVMKLPGFGDSREPDINARRARVVADHIRGACFLLADGVRFSNKDQGYILRRIVRRAADQFLVAEFSFDGVVDAIVLNFNHQYLELLQQRDAIKRLLKAELDTYRRVLNLDVSAIVKKMRHGQGPESSTELVAGPSHTLLTPDEAFTLFSTYGISLDRLARVGFTFVRPAVEEKITEHQEKSRAGAAQKFGGHGLGHGPDTPDISTEDAAKITRLHTATHLLHAALRQILGETVRQGGSDITPERLRFDFTYGRKLTADEKKQVEDLVNEKIKADLPVTWAMMPYQQAIDAGALAFFKEKYADEVKVYSIGDFSKELCGGPHVEHTSEVGHFKISGEQSVGAGLRRIKAVID